MIRLLTCTVLLTLSAAALELSSIDVEAQRLYTPLFEGAEVLDQKSSLDSEALSTNGPPAQSSAVMALDMAPGVNVESVDAYGLGGSSMRERGVDNNFLGLSIEGIPSYSIRPIGPRVDIVDLENVASLDFYRGAQSPKNHSGVGSRGGLIDLVWRKPQKETALDARSRFGGDGFYKLYGRVDSGDIASLPLGAYASISQSSAHKWKGESDLGPRTNLSAGLGYTLEGLHVSVLYNRTLHKRHDFMPLSYAQTKDLSANYDLDYQSSESNRSDYYDYRKRDGRYDDLSLHVSTDCGGLTCKLKLYGSNYFERSDEGDGIGTVDARRVGLMASAHYQDAALEAEVGAWMEQAQLDKYVRHVSLSAQHSHLGWKWLSDNDGATELLSPYVLGAYSLEPWRFEAGLRGMFYKEAGNDTYLPNNTYADFDAAIAHAALAPGGRVGAMRYAMIIPTLGAHYRLDEALELFAKWGRGYQRPYRYSFAAAYGANQKGLRDKLQAQGKGLEDIVKQWKMEEADLFDAGVLYQSERTSLGMSLFYHRHRNLLASTYDETLAVDYLQNVSDAEVYGLEADLGVEPLRNLWLYLRPAWMQSALSDDLHYANATVALKGNEMSETPRFTCKAGGVYRHEAHSISVMGRYIGARYADVRNEEKVDGYATFDARYMYTLKGAFGEGSLWIAATNLGDARYISSIGSADMLEDTPTYYVGAPRSVMVGLEGRF